MHRTLLIAALLIGAAIELTGCGHCDCGLPYETAQADASVAPFLLDDTTPRRTLVAEVGLFGQWEAWDEEGSQTPSLFFTARVEPRLGGPEGPAGVDVRVRTEDEAVLAAVSLPYEGALDYTLRAESAFAACEPGMPCNVVAYIDVARDPDVGTAQVSVDGLVQIASWAVYPELVAAISFLPPLSTSAAAGLPAFVVDGAAPTRTFSLRAHLDGPWQLGLVDDEGLPADPGLRVALEVEPLLDEAVAPISVRALDATDGALVAETTIDPADDAPVATLDLRAALADCEAGTPCDVELMIAVTRAGDAGAMLATLRADGDASGPPDEAPFYELELEPL